MPGDGNLRPGRGVNLQNQEKRMLKFARLIIAAPLAVAVIASGGCTTYKNEIALPGTFTFDCKAGTDADCDAQAYAACPNGYENAARITNDARNETRAIRCR